jgi:uncharacterized protein (TIGR03118 family)
MQRHKIVLTVFFGLGLMLASSAAMAQYQLTNLDSNQLGWARHTDPLQVNGWGIARSAGSPWWVSDQGSGWSTLYDAKGDIEGLKVLIPTAGNGPNSPTGLNGPGQPTGIVFNGSTDGEFQVGGWSSDFIFATLDGTISGWAPQTNKNQAILAVDNSASGAQYTALAITNKPSGNFIYATDLVNNKVDVYNGTFTWVTSFTDPTIPSGWGPFGITDINGLLYVTFADIAEGPGGIVDVYNEDGTFVNRLIEGAPLNQPWGIAVSPKGFGPLSDALLISNNTNSGTINAFNSLTGKFIGTLKDTSGKAIVINQLWAIGFGGGTAANGAKNQLFFTAGPGNNLAGTFGVIGLK